MNWLIMIALVGTLIWTLLPRDSDPEPRRPPDDDLD
jgi:hypothetical protein